MLLSLQLVFGLVGSQLRLTSLGGGATGGQRRGRPRVVARGVATALVTFRWGRLIRGAGARVPGLWGGVVAAAGPIMDIRQGLRARVAWLATNGVSGMLGAWKLA